GDKKENNGARARAARCGRGVLSMAGNTHLKSGVGDKVVPWCTRPDVSPLRYPGGKRKLVSFVADLIKRANLQVDLFVEPFAGGAAVSIALLESGHVQTIALADADPLIASFWATVFSRNAGRLANMVCDTKVTLREWHRQKELSPRSTLAAAFKCLFLNRTS